VNTALSLGLTAGAIVLASIGLTGWMSRRVVEIVPAKGRFVEIDGQRIHYLDQGEGPCLVLIHGLGGQTGHLTYDLVDRLTESFRVIVVDRPGSGHSPAFRQGKSGLSRQASLIAALMEHLKLGPSLILGHSLGGAIALALALDNPALVRGLVLVSPLTQIETRVPDAFKLLAIRSAILRRVVGWAVATPASMLGSKPVLAALFGPDTPPSDFGTRGGGLLSLRPSA
jgi:pimeloyl-ACP methyl ester carboxylesterase